MTARLCRKIFMASSTLFEDKQSVRSSIKAALKQASDAELARQSQKIQRILLDQHWFDAASTVGIYLHCARLREVDTSMIVQEALSTKKRCYVPLVQDKQSNMALLHLDSLEGLQTVPPFGIQEPSLTYADGSPRENILQSEIPLDLLVMPGLGFDSRGNRLGRGGGYYDKFLATLAYEYRQKGWRLPTLAALAFQEQLADRIPVGETDVRVDVIVMADGVLECSERPLM